MNNVTSMAAKDVCKMLGLSAGSGFMTGAGMMLGALAVTTIAKAIEKKKANKAVAEEPKKKEE